MSLGKYLKHFKSELYFGYMDKTGFKSWISYLVCTLLLPIQLEARFNSFVHKGDAFPKCKYPSFTSIGSDKSKTIVSTLSLENSSGDAFLLLLQSKNDDELMADCQMSLNLLTTGKNNYTVSIENVYHSPRQHKNVEGAQCNITLDIAFKTKVLENNNIRDYRNKDSPAQLPDFPGVAKLLVPDPVLNIMDSEKERDQKSYGFLYATYTIKNYENECFLQFQEFTFAMPKNGTLLEKQLYSTMCKRKKCRVSSIEKPMAMSKVVISCMVVFVAILFTGCFVMICTCSTLMNLCASATGTDTRQARNDNNQNFEL